MKQQFFLDTPDTFKTYVYEHNRKIIPDSATVTIYRPGSADRLVDSVQMTVAADGLLSLDLAAGQNDAAGMNYKAVVTYSYGGRDWQVTLFYDVVRSRLVKVITDDDIMAELPQLRDNGWRVRGTAESGTTSSIVDSELKRYDDDYFTGGLAYSVEKDETREVTGFQTTTGTVLTTAFSTPVSTDRYILTRSYTAEIQRAFEKVAQELERAGRRPHLVIDPYELREVHIYFSVAEACKGLVTGREDIWWDLWKEYEKKALDLLGDLRFKYDASEDGFVSGAETRAKMKRLVPVRR